MKTEKSASLKAPQGPEQGGEPVVPPAVGEELTKSLAPIASENEEPKSNKDHLFVQWDLTPDTEYGPPTGIEEMPLEDLAEKINAGHDTVKAETATAQKYGTAALQAAIRAGHYLRKSQEKRKDSWETWLKTNCPGVSRSTAYRYLALAKNVSHVRQSKRVQTLRQAYLAIGVLKPKKKSSPDLTRPAEIKPSDYVAAVKSSRELLESLRSLSFNAMEVELRDQLSGELSELSALCTELQKQLLERASEPTGAAAITLKTPRAKSREPKGGSK